MLHVRNSSGRYNRFMVGGGLLRMKCSRVLTLSKGMSDYGIRTGVLSCRREVGGVSLSSRERNATELTRADRSASYLRHASVPGVPGRITREALLKRQECLSSNVPREVEDILRSRCPRLSRCIHGGYLLLTSATRVGSRLIAMKHRRRRRRHGPCEHCPGSPHQQLRANESKPPPLARPDWPSFSSGGLHRLIDVQLPPGHLPIEGQLSRTPAPWPTAAPRSDRGG
jgi:hypothetical protein